MFIMITPRTTVDRTSRLTSRRSPVEDRSVWGSWRRRDKETRICFGDPIMKRGVCICVSCSIDIGFTKQKGAHHVESPPTIGLQGTYNPTRLPKLQDCKGLRVGLGQVRSSSADPLLHSGLR